MKRFTRASLAAVAASRLPGYVDAVMAAAARQDDTHVWLDDDQYENLRAKFAIPTGPPLLKRAANFAAAAAKHVAAGMPRASDEEINRRFTICQQCEHYDGRTCLKCGCPVVREKQFVSKLAWASERCPVGKW